MIVRNSDRLKEWFVDGVMDEWNRLGSYAVSEAQYDNYIEEKTR